MPRSTLKLNHISEGFTCALCRSRSNPEVVHHVAQVAVAHIDVLELHGESKAGRTPHFNSESVIINRCMLRPWKALTSYRANRPPDITANRDTSNQPAMTLYHARKAKNMTNTLHAIAWCEEQQCWMPQDPCTHLNASPQDDTLIGRQSFGFVVCVAFSVDCMSPNLLYFKKLHFHIHHICCTSTFFDVQSPRLTRALHSFIEWRFREGVC